MELISKIVSLSLISSNATEWLSENMESFSFRKNEIVFKEGSICRYLYYINEGMIGGYTQTEDKKICNWLSIENDFATSYYSFISRKASYETIVCLEDSQTQAISYTKLHQLYQLFPETERIGRLILEEYYSRLEERLISIQFKSAKERYQLLCEQRPELIKRAPLGLIAGYLGINQETLSRIRAGQH